MYSGARAKEELATNSKVVGNKRSIKVMFDGEEFGAYNKEHEIHLPDIPNNAQVSQQQLMQMRGLADHEAFHSRYTPLSRWTEIGEYCHAWNDHYSMSVLNGFEDPRIEKLGMREFKGTRQNLQATVTGAVKMQAADVLELKPELWVVQMPLVITWLGRKANGMEVNLTPELSALADKFSKYPISELFKHESFDDLLAGVAEFMDEHWKMPTLKNYLAGVEPPQKPPEPQPKSGKGNQSAKGKGKSEPSPFAPPKTGEEDQGQGRKACEEYKSGVGVIDAGLSRVMKNITTDQPYFSDPESIRYMEVPTIKDIGNPITWFNTYGFGEGLSRALRSEVQTRKDTGKRTNTLDTRKLVDAYNRKERIYKNRKAQEKGMNTAVSFLLDCSNSMRSHTKPMLSITASLARGISNAGIPFEITGFTEATNHLQLGTIETKKLCRTAPLHIYKVKEFDAPFQAFKVAGLTKVQQGFTPDGEALELALARIDKRPEKRKVVIVLTDGYTQVWDDEPYEVNGKEYDRNAVANAHKQAVIDQASEMGIELYWIALGHHAIKGIPAKHILQVKNMNAMKQHIFKMFYDSIARKGK